MTRRTLPTCRLLLAVGLAVTVIGLVVTAVAVAQPVSFGWFATAPLSGTTFTPGGVHLVSTATLVGAAVLVVGLLLLAAWTGYRMAVRRTTATLAEPTRP
jgi:heme/copper-type cytochrome/quinol oxidase subunit 1